jgi:hypothetical protein
MFNWIDQLKNKIKMDKSHMIQVFILLFFS